MTIPFRLFLDTQNIISQQSTPPFHIEVIDWLEQTNEIQQKEMVARSNKFFSHLVLGYTNQRKSNCLHAVS